MVSQSTARAAVSFDGYTSVVQIHEGSETAVYRARAAGTGAPVILKVTKNEYPTWRELARLRREFSIMRELDVERTPKPIGLEEHGRGLMLVMPDLCRRTLREVLDERRLDIETALTIAISVCDVLSAIHQRRVIHKDITPKNIVIDELTPAAYVIDFGISARILQEVQGAGAAGGLEGTLVYIAPEQTGRLNRAVDHRADLYSLGVVLYEMLTGSVPFPAADEAQALIHNHLTRQATPAHERDSSVPAPLSDIVMTLLAKMPEERYQSDAGLRADLAECLRQWKENGGIERFPLRRFDKVTELLRPQRLYGRDSDLAALEGALDRARLRGPELALVSGYSGVGKSALVQEIRKQSAHQGGYFISGKFDQISRDVPLAPVVHAFRELILQILTEPPRSLAQWKGDIADALGENGRLLTDLIPELELILGPQPEVPALAPDQARNRFELTLQNFLDVFASSEHPLVIFLDDLQWIDPASLKLLKLLLVNPYTEHMLIVGAYRDNEVEPGHPLTMMLDEIKRAGRSITEILLCPLDREMVRCLVADMLTTPAEEVFELAGLVFEKTHGNPFFAHQFMVTLSQEGLLTFDLTAGAWRWDADGIRGANVTDNVVELMVSRLQRLAPATQHAVMLAACIGHQFNLRSLATIAERSVVETASDLWEAMREGFIVPLDSDYRLLEEAPGDRVSGELGTDFEVHYRFLHDRILQAAYSLVDPDRKQELHLAIGRLLWRRGGPPVRDEDLLEVVRHLNLGVKGITGPDERLDLARLNLRAGRRAKAATAYDAAAGYLRSGIALLREADWETDYDTCLALHLEGAECAYLSGDVDRAKELFSAAVTRARTDADRALVCRMRVRILISLTEYAEAMKVGGEGLLQVGFPFVPEDLESPAVFMAELGLIQTNLRDRRIEDLSNEPELQDPRLRAILELIDAMGVASYFTGATAFGVLTFKAVNLALKHGPTDVSPFHYVSCGMILAHVLNRVPEGLAFAKLAMELSKKYPNPAQTPRVCVCYGPCILLEGTVRDAERYFAITRDAGMEVGDFTMLGTGSFLVAFSKLVAGDQLDDVLECADKNLAIARRIREPQAVINAMIARQVALNLAGRTRDRSTLSDDTFDEQAFLSGLTDPESSHPLFHYHILKLQRHLLYGEHEEAIAAADAAEQRLMFVVGTPHSMHLPFYRCILHFALPAPKTPEEAAQRDEILARNRGKLDLYAASSPAGYKHMKALVDAEAARAAGEIEGALRLYEQAVELSHEARAPHVEAMANELAARCYISIGALRAAGAYMRDAHRAYLHWGAVAKAEALEAEYANLLPASGSEGRRKKSTTTSTATDATNTSSTILSRTTLGSLRDSALILRAAQAISSEIDLPKVIDRLASLVLENAGAQRGALILSRDGELVVTATFGEGTSTFDEGQGTPFESYDDVAQSVVLYVARTQESVVLDNTSTLSRFSEDKYIRSGTPKSLLCLPLLHQARLSGILYLENRATSGVFNAARVELLALLSSQAAISIENARLISNVRAANGEVKRANERLEVEVTHRTEELGRANKDLMAAKERLERELAQREQIEQERTTLQEQVIQAQRARLAEMSTPVIPITDEIIVMPLIGTVDRERAQQVLSAALEGVQRHRAQVLILDITGIKQIDTNVAGTLLGVAGALRLLGAEAVLTGIAPDIATTLVGLGVELSSFMTKGTLQSGMDYALRRVRISGYTRGPARR
ncbi:MAG TPA: AAA family ATPase [Polyangiaceae bacterium]|nr:AAA family ATPase [Polyangiaceae bacterium]